MSGPQELAIRFRWLLLVLGMICFAAGVFFLLGALPWGAGAFGTPISIFFNNNLGGSPETALWMDTLLIVGIMLVTQWLFLCPRGGWKMRLAEQGRPMWWSVITAAFVATLLSTAVVATLLEIPGWWPTFRFYYAVWAAMGIVWITWTCLFYLYWRGTDRQNYLDKMLGWLFIGSILELLVAAPVHAMTMGRHGDKCYCERGSYTGLVLGGTVLLWAFGPGVILLFVREKQRRESRLKNAVLR